MRTRALRMLLVAATVGIAGCDGIVEPDCASASATDAQLFCTTGTVEYIGFEGGFWAIRGDDAVLYDPHGSLPGALRQAGLRVAFKAEHVSDAACVHMAGPIVDVIEIHRR